MPVPELTVEAFLRFVGRGQPSALHLAECLHRHVLPSAKERAAILAGQEDEAARAELEALENLGPDAITDNWLSPAKHPELPDLNRPAPPEEMPALLRLSPYELTRELQDINPGYRLVLGTAGLNVEDVAELLWDCRGAVTHLEIFNMKGWMEGKMTDIGAIGELQRALIWAWGRASSRWCAR